MRLTCSCLERGATYEAGPTACIAHPKVVADIKKQVSSQRILSAADARFATLAGLLDIPPLSKSGFNDGVIYPPVDLNGPLLAGARQRPSKALSLAPPKTKTTLNCLVFLVDFSDNQGAKPPQHYQNLLFDSNNPNSMNQFYKDMSYGKLDISGTVTNWIRAKKPYSYYTAGQSGTGSAFPANVPGLLQEVLTTYTQNNSLAPFDLNKDGYVDGLFLIHAGSGAESEPDPQKRRDMIWSHKWTLPQPFTKNGVSAYAYFTAPEDGELGVFAHEFGHFIGLPDLYDTSYRSFGIGDWCLMAGGSWNGGGKTPARLSAWCLAQMGWIAPKVVKSAGARSLATLETSKTACLKLWTKGKGSTEYFLVENRQQTGRDAALPGSGLAVWHIDESQSDNTNPLAYKVALVQADGRRDLEFSKNQGDAADLFPGSKKVTSLGDKGSVHPHTRSNSGAMTGVGLSNIKASKGIVSFNVTV